MTPKKKNNFFKKIQRLRRRAKKKEKKDYHSNETLKLFALFLMLLLLFVILLVFNIVYDNGSDSTFASDEVSPDRVFEIRLDILSTYSTDSIIVRKNFVRKSSVVWDDDSTDFEKNKHISEKDFENLVKTIFEKNFFELESYYDNYSLDDSITQTITVKYETTHLDPVFRLKTQYVECNSPLGKEKEYCSKEIFEMINNIRELWEKKSQ